MVSFNAHKTGLAILAILLVAPAAGWAQTDAGPRLEDAPFIVPGHSEGGVPLFLEDALQANRPWLWFDSAFTGTDSEPEVDMEIPAAAPPAPRVNEDAFTRRVRKGYSDRRPSYTSRLRRYRFGEEGGDESRLESASDRLPSIEDRFLDSNLRPGGPSSASEEMETLSVLFPRGRGRWSRETNAPSPREVEAAPDVDFSFLDKPIPSIEEDPLPSSTLPSQNIGKIVDPLEKLRLRKTEQETQEAVADRESRKVQRITGSAEEGAGRSGLSPARGRTLDRFDPRGARSGLSSGGLRSQGLRSQGLTGGAGDSLGARGGLRDTRLGPRRDLQPGPRYYRNTTGDMRRPDYTYRFEGPRRYSTGQFEYGNRTSYQGLPYYRR